MRDFCVCMLIDFYKACPTSLVNKKPLIKMFMCPNIHSMIETGF